MCSLLLPLICIMLRMRAGMCWDCGKQGRHHWATYHVLVAGPFWKNEIQMGWRNLRHASPSCLAVLSLQPLCLEIWCRLGGPKWTLKGGRVVSAPMLTAWLFDCSDCWHSDMSHLKCGWWCIVVNLKSIICFQCVVACWLCKIQNSCIVGSCWIHAALPFLTAGGQISIGCVSDL